MRKGNSPLRSLAVILMAVFLAGGVAACGGGETIFTQPPTTPPPTTPPPTTPPPTTPPPTTPPPTGGDEPPRNGQRLGLGETFEPSNPRSPSSWETPEYGRSNGLGLINARQGYARRTTGQPGGRGITVAVLDDGVDFDHPDIDPGQHDNELAFTGADLPRDHGTPVAGVIAARRDGRGVHGVAYAANIQSIGTCKSSGGCFGDVLDVANVDETAADIASAAGVTAFYGNIDSSPEASSHIMNMSFAYTNAHNIPQITSAMRDAAAAGRIMVAALGNCFEGGPSCYANGEFDEGIGPSGAPASNVADPGIAGYAIAVGSMNSSGTWRADHSNTCGSVKEYCLFAPGENIYTTVDGGGHGTVSGTSFAAPHVAGAAAVLWAAFPNKRGNQIVQRLLSTATPVPGDGALGSDGISFTFGHGALDLGAAMNPVGFLSLTTAGGSLVPLADSYVALPPGFSAPPQSKALADTVVYDEQMFPFYHDLAASFRVSDRRAEGMLRDFLSSLGASSSISFDRTDASLEFVHEDDDTADLRWDATDGDEQDEELDVYRFAHTPTPGLTIAVGQGFGSIGSSNDFVAARTQRTIFADEFSVAPFATFAGPGLGLTVDWQVNEGTTIDLVGKDGRGYGGSSSAQLASLGLTREIGESVTLGARYGTLRERGSLMGIRTEGAFASTGHATTNFVDVSMEGRVSNDMTLFGSFSHGITGGGTPGAESSLVSAWSDARAGSFVIGTEFVRLMQDSDRLTLTASSPFRADRATVHVEVPDREVADQVVGYTRHAIDLVPGGREHRVQWVYEMRPGVAWLGLGREAVSFAIGSYLRMESDHDETADPEYGAAAKIRATF